MEEKVLYAYRKGKFKTCLQLISSLQGTDDIVKNLLIENCKLMCESYIIIFENNPVKIFEMQEQHYLFFEKVTSLGVISSSIPIQLRLNVTFNFTFWLLFYSDVNLSTTEKEEYLQLINKGLLSVLGKPLNSLSTHNPTRKILNNLINLRNLIFNEEWDTVLLILELIIVVIIYVVKLKKSLFEECLKIVSSFTNCSSAVKSVICERDFKKSVSVLLFKFSLCEKKTHFSDVDMEVINYLDILESTFLFLVEDFKGSLKSLQRNISSNRNVLWNYLVALNSFELENWNLCSRCLIKITSVVDDNNLKTRLHILQGKLNSVERKHKEALREFETALSLSPNCSAVYYYIGQEYGKMGLFDLMVENFEKLVQVVQHGGLDKTLRPNFESTLLDLIHPSDEITEIEAQYAVAVAYGLNENFKSAAQTFERVLEFSENCSSDRKKRIIELPKHLTILHEASVMNLLHGNLVRAEQILLDAIDQYIPEKHPPKCDNKMLLINKDIEWLQQVIQQELLETDLEPKELLKETFYSEDLLLFFPQNVIGLLILAEIQRIQQVGDHKTILSNVFSIFSKYLSSTQKKETMEEDEKHALTLVKALAGKTCITIATIQINEDSDAEVEKMFKRALSCNKGDRDALCNYYRFLLSAGRSSEALKLWKTFFKEKQTVRIDLLQSFSLRYLLLDKITTREFEKIQVEVKAMEDKFS